MGCAAARTASGALDAGVGDAAAVVGGSAVGRAVADAGSSDWSVAFISGGRPVAASASARALAAAAGVCAALPWTGSGTDAT